MITKNLQLVIRAARRIISRQNLKTSLFAAFCVLSAQLAYGESGEPTFIDPPRDQSVLIGSDILLSGVATCAARSITISNDPTSGNATNRVTVFELGQASGTFSIDYDFFGIPDELQVYYDNLLLYDTGLLAGFGTSYVSYGPGLETTVTVVMNQDNETYVTVWEYTIFASLPATYQWRYNGVIIPGSTNNNYTITNAQLSATGLYSVIASNAFGSATNTYRVRVLNPEVAPYLTPSFSGQSLVISWPTNYVGFTLESTSNLEQTNSWTPVTNGVFANGIDWVVTGSSVGSRFYRLHK